MSDFCPVIQFESIGEVDCAIPVGTITHLCERGKAGRYVHYTENGFPQWDKLCALEDALVDRRVNKGFIFMVGSMKDDPEVRGWLEYEDCIIVPYGPERQALGSDVGLFSRESFDELEYVVHAFSECADDSAIKLNKIVRAIHGKPISHTGVVG